MAAFAYVLPPVSGALAYLLGSSPRVRFHGSQAVVIGVVWPVLLYLASALSSGITQIVFLLGVIVCLGAFVATLAGRDVRLPVIGPVLARSVDLAGD